MQLGELQENLQAFDERGVTVVVVSVDPPEVTIPWAEKKGFGFPMASDTTLSLVRALDLENPDSPGIALHAVFIVDTDGRVFYRKIARRRAYSGELLDAIDYHARAGAGASPGP